MIQLNTNIQTNISVDMKISGLSTSPALRFLLFTPDFFIGFEGSDKDILVPALNKIAWPEKNIVAGHIEVILDDYYLTIWKDTIHLNDVKHIDLKENRINVTVTFEDEPEYKRPVVKIDPIHK